MNFEELVEKRRTIRDFSNKAINIEIINSALSAGLKAPSYNHLKEWDFILVKDMNKRLELIQTEHMTDIITEEMKHSFDGYENVAKEMYMSAIPKQKRMILTAPEVLVVVYKPKTQVCSSKKVYDLNCLASVWCCIENILLSLAEQDVFVVTFIPKNTPAIKTILNIPEELEVASIIPLGYKADNATIVPQKQVNLKEKLHTNVW
jgi:nitroreductase